MERPGGRAAPLAAQAADSRRRLSLFALYGRYFLLAGGGTGLIAVGNLLYLVAGLVVGAAAMASSTLGEEGGRAGVGVNARAIGVVAFAAVAAATGYAVASASPQQTGAVPYKDDCPPFRARNTLGMRWPPSRAPGTG